MPNNPLPPSQRAREYAADLYEAGHLPDPCCPPKWVAANIRAGKLDDGDYVQAFARFEADILQPSEGSEPVAYLEATQETLGRIAYAIIEGSAGRAAADHARNFVTANWTDAVRSARNVLTEVAALHPTPVAAGSDGELAADIRNYVEILANQPLGVSMTEWNIISNAFLRAATRLQQLTQQEPAGDVVEAWPDDAMRGNEQI